MLMSISHGEFQIDDKDNGKRIDVVSSEMSGISRSQIQHLIEKGLLTVNTQRIRANYRAKLGDRISIQIQDEEQKLLKEDLPVEVLYKDDFLIVLDKPAGMVVYPAAGHPVGTLMNAVAYKSGKLASVGGPLRPGVVHRLDKETSGVMVVALDDTAY